MCPWPQPGTDRHGIIFYKIHVTTLGPFQHKQALPFRGSPDTLFHILLPLGSQENTAHRKRGLHWDLETWQGRAESFKGDWGESPNRVTHLSGCGAKEEDFQEGTQRTDTPKIWPFNTLATGLSAPPADHNSLQTLLPTPPDIACQSPLPISSVSIARAGFPPSVVPPSIQQAFAEHLLCAKHYAGAATVYKAESFQL